MVAPGTMFLHSVTQVNLPAQHNLDLQILFEGYVVLAEGLK
jgi:hypothetical protein